MPVLKKDDLTLRPIDSTDTDMIVRWRNNERVRTNFIYRGDFTQEIHNNWLDKRDAFLQNVARQRYNGSVSRGYKNAIEIKRKNGCHVVPQQPLQRQ